MSKVTEAGKEGLLSRFGFRYEDMPLLKRAMLYTFLFGFLAHGFMMTNLSISHDAVFNFYDELPAHQHQIELGRFMEPLYRELTGSCLLMPWSLGLVAFFWLGTAVFLVCRLFDLSGRWEVLLTAGIMTVNISVTATAAAYEPWLAADMFTLLMAVFGVWCWRLYGKSHRISRLALGMAAVIISLAIYQSYLSVTVVLIIMLSIQDLIMKKNEGGGVKVFQDGCAGAGMIAAGGIVYYILMLLSSILSYVPLLEGKHDSVTNLWDNQETILQRALYCLKEAITHFFAKDENIYPYPVIWAANFLIGCVGICLAVCLVRQIRGELQKGEWLLLALLVVALPFAAYMVRLLNPYVHDLMVYSVWLLYMFPILLSKWTYKCNWRWGKYSGAVVILISFILFSLIQTDNAVYVKKRVESEATLSLMTEVMAEVERTEGYVPGETELIFAGDITKILRPMPGMDRIKGISGNNKPTAIVDPNIYQEYFNHVMLRKANFIYEKDAGKWQEVQKMPAYPQAGYVRMVDGIVVVKWN